MSVSFSLAVPISLRAPGIQYVVLDELSSLAQLKGGWDPSKGKLAQAVKGGLCKVPKPKVGDGKILFVLDRLMEMRGFGTAVGLIVMLAGKYYRIGLLREAAAVAGKKHGYKDSWTIESVKQLTAGRAYNLLYAASKEQKAKIAEDSAAEQIMLEALERGQANVGAPMNGNAVGHSTRIAPDQIGRNNAATVSPSEHYILSDGSHTQGEELYM